MEQLSELEILHSLIDNGLDEVISEMPVNHMLIAPQAIAEMENQEQKIAVKITPAINQEVAKAGKNSFINPEYSTNRAISKLAQKFTQDNLGSFNDADISIKSIVKKAQELAQKAQNIDELKQAIENFDGCNLKKMATNTVFSDGNKNAKIMVIGEAPGNDEDLRGIPFCGDSGQLLDQMFGAINMNRKADLYLTNVLFWRPPGNRKPTDEELTIARPFVDRHIELINPDLIILVGAIAMKEILGNNDTISKVRGQFIDFKIEALAKTVKTFTIFHPSYLMRQSSKKKVAWQDMLAIKKYITQQLAEK